MKRQPFFVVDGHAFVDLLYNFDNPLDASPTDLTRLLASIPHEDLVIGRRLDRSERALLRATRDDADAEVFARLIPDPPQRWLTPHRRR